MKPRLQNFFKEAGIGAYILFQETYHKDSYEKHHPTGPKHDYAYHTEAMGERMIQEELANIPKDKVREICKEHLEKIEQGIRVFRF